MKFGIFPAAAPVSKPTLEQALNHISSLGHSYSCPLDGSRAYGTGDNLYSAASIEDRIACLIRLLEDPSIDLILALRGAYGSYELLPRLPYALIESAQKPFVGMSDLTSILVALYAKTTVPVLHGPVLVTGFCPDEIHTKERAESQNYLFALLENKSRNINSKLTAVSPSAASVEGKIIGGNLTVFASLIGTEYQAQFSNHIVLLEDRAEPLYKIHRMLVQLRDSCSFENCKGIVLGHFSQCENAQGQIHPTLVEVFNDVFKKTAVNIWQGFPFGHEARNISFRYGQFLHIDNDGVMLLS